MSRRYPTVKKQEEALDEMRRILGRDIVTLTSDEEAENATPEILERVVLFEGILGMFDILEDKVTAGVLLASKVKHYDDGWAPTSTFIELKSQAEICLELMLGPEEG